MNKWYDETAHYKKIKILNIGDNSNSDAICTAILYLDRRKVAKVKIKITVDEYNSGVKRTIDMLGFKPEIDSGFYMSVYYNLLYFNFEKYMELPKLSKCSDLLKEIYDEVCDSRNKMCHITEGDWREMYRDRYNRNDIIKLKKEVEEYKLQDVITFNDGEYKILGYEDLETRFNDDRSIAKVRDSFER